MPKSYVFKSESEVTQSCRTLGDPMDCTCQTSPSMGLSRQDYWSGLPFPSLGDLPNPGIEPRSPALQADSLLPEPQGGFCVFHVFMCVWKNPTYVNEDQCSLDSILVSFDFVPSICPSNSKNYYKIVLRKCSTSGIIDLRHVMR